MTNTLTTRLACVFLLAAPLSANAQNRVTDTMPSLAPLVETVAPAVVNISVSEVVTAMPRPRGNGPLEEFFEEFEEYLGEDTPLDLPPPRERFGAGSGVIVDAENGYVLTNHHVVYGANDIRVTLIDDRTLDATVIGSDRRSDLAVLKIASDDLTAIPIASPDTLMVGDYVVAIGNPFGFSNTVTSGIVSGLGRQFIEDNAIYQDFIQTDASINPGNSGGALVNLDGQLVGINSAIATDPGGGNVGIGFAIPSKMVAYVMERLLEQGEVQRGLLGVTIDSITPRFAENYGLNVSSGALVLDVQPGSAAERTGIRINDIIVGIDDEPVADSNELRNTVAMRLPEQEIEVRLVRNGNPRTVSAILRSNIDRNQPEEEEAEHQPRPSVFGGVRLSANPDGDGVRVENVRPGTLAYSRDLRPGDLIKAFMTSPNRPIALNTVAEAEESVADADTVVLLIERRHQETGEWRERLILMR